MADLGELLVKLSADFKNLKSGLGKARKELSDFKERAQSFAFSLKGIFAVVGVSVGLSKLSGMFHDLSTEVDNLAKMSLRLGISTEALSELQYAAQLSGVSVNAMAMAFQRMVRRVSEAAQGTGQAKDALIELGLNAAKLNALSPDKQFLAIAQAMEKVQNQADRVRIAFRLWDSQGVAVVQMLKNGARGLREMMAEARAFGISINRDFAQQMEATRDEVTRLEAAWNGLKIAIMAAFGPAIIKLMRRISTEIRESRSEIVKFISEVKSLLQNPLVRTLMSAALGYRFGGPLGAGISALVGGFYAFRADYQKRLKEQAEKAAPLEVSSEAPTPTPSPTPEPPGLADKKGTAKKATEDLLKYLTDYLDAKRKLELKGAEESYQTFKTEQERKKAELELALAEGRITGQEYYQTLYEMAQAEADASLKLIDEKIAKEKEAYEWARKEIEEKAKAGEISPEAQELALKKLAVEHAMRLKGLEGEALREKIELQKEHLKLLRDEYENRERIADILTSAAMEAALGPIAEKEAEIARLLEEQRKNREELVRLGATQAQVSEYNLLARQREFMARFGEQITGYADIVASGFSDILDSLAEGGRDLVSTLRNLFKNLFNQALKPGMDQLKQLLITGFTKLFGEVGASVANALMGLIGLIGMLLTGGGGAATWSPAGVEKGVTAHEAVRGIIAGETSIPIAQVSESLAEAVAPHLQVLRQIEANTRGGLGGNINVRVLVEGVKEAVKEAIETYFREYLVMGAEA
ncbi:MAG: hypothetical protein JRI66_11195 [Deltaproteobacteria bacterium]|nr:hypothetical protein [Deltaproteobacteria bacterium]